MKIFKSIPLYIKLYKNSVKVTRLDTETTLERISLQPFSNSRMVIADFKIAHELLKNIIIQLVGKSFLAPSLSIIIHQLDLNEGGLSPVEKRILIDCVKHLNAKEIYLLDQKHEMSNQEALNQIKTVRDSNKGR